MTRRKKENYKNFNLVNEIANDVLTRRWKKEKMKTRRNFNLENEM